MRACPAFAPVAQRGFVIEMESGERERGVSVWEVAPLRRAGVRREVLSGRNGEYI